MFCSISFRRRLSRGYVMSIEIYALSDRRLTSIADWQQAIDREGFNLRLDSSRPFEDLSGHLPAQRGSQHAGFECDHWDAAEIIDGYGDFDFGRRWKEISPSALAAMSLHCGAPTRPQPPMRAPRKGSSSIHKAAKSCSRTARLRSRVISIRTCHSAPHVARPEQRQPGPRVELPPRISLRSSGLRSGRHGIRR